MSRVGKAPIVIPDKVTVKVQGRHVEAEGPLGKLALDINPKISVKIDNKCLIFERSSDEKLDCSLHGLERTRVFNMIKGVLTGFTKELNLIGVGYRAQISGKKLILQLGFSHAIEFDLPQNVQVNVNKQTIITLASCDKEELGLVAARLRALRPPEPYKGKGVRYADEHVLRKAGKAAVSGGKKA